jgi:hypothetical protein
MTFVEILIFIVGSAFGVLWFGVIILPIFYGLSRSLYLIARNTLKAKAVLFYLGTLVFWTAIFTGIAFVLAVFLPSVANYLYNSPGFYYGQWLGVIGSLIRAFSKPGREHLRDDFGAAMAKYKKDSDEAMRRKALETILKKKNEVIDEALKTMLVWYVFGKDTMVMPEVEIIKGLLEDIKVVGKRENIPEEWTQELIGAFKRKVEEYRSMDEKHSTEMIKLILKELKSKREKVSEESR